jgi:hypothetical protein
MKRRFLIPTMIFLLISFVSTAQTDTSKYRLVITKGYYSIGNNSEKLPAATVVKTFPLATPPVVQKGYYSMEADRKKLPVSYGIQVSKSRFKATKGYYGIGYNHQKLN